MSKFIFDDTGQITQTVDFAYGDVDEKVFGHKPHEIENSTVFQCTCRLFQRVVQWIWNGDAKNLDGFECRTIIVLWIFLPVLHDNSMTEMAKKMGKKKQSLGRWVEDFKKRFPEITKHCQHIRNK